jgi:hypothetical protein
MLKKKVKRQISPFRRFPDPFGNEVAEIAERMEISAVADENGEQHWLRKTTDLPPFFGRS